jgi:hypothetical protein
MWAICHIKAPEHIVVFQFKRSLIYMTRPLTLKYLMAENNKDLKFVCDIVMGSFPKGFTW